MSPVRGNLLAEAGDEPYGQWMTRAAVVAAVLIAVPALAPAAAAEQPPRAHAPGPAAKPPAPPKPALRVTPAVVVRGALVRVTGRGCEAGDPVTIYSPVFSGRGPTVVGSVRTTAGAAGGFAIRTRIPRTTRKGRYAVAASCAGTELGLIAWLRVT